MGAFVAILRRCGAPAVAVSLLLLGPARAGEGNPGVPFRVFSPDSPFLHGFTGALSGAGDVDGDGLGDVAMAATEAYQGGKVVIASGYDGSVIRILAGAGSEDGFGEALALVGDLDGRGTPDLLVGAPRGRGIIPESSQPTFARVFAGEDGAVLFDSGPREPGAAFGSTVAGVGDLDGDGVPDFAVGSHCPPLWLPTGKGSLEIRSGKEGTLLGTLHGQEEGDHYGASIAPLGDLDGDEVPDLAVGIPGSFQGGTGRGRISIVSGATLQEIRSISGLVANSYFGRTMAFLGSTSAGARVLAVGAPRAAQERGEVLFLDAATGDVRTRIRVDGVRNFGSRLSAIGDQDGDGIRELAAVAGTIDDEGGDDAGGLVLVLSGGTGRILFSRRGWQQEFLAFRMAPIGDVDGDGREDLGMGIELFSGDGEVRVYRMNPDPGVRSVRVALQRPPGLPGPGIRGRLEIGVQGPHQPFHLDLRTPPEFDLGSAYLEDGPGTGTYAPIGRTVGLDTVRVADTELHRHWGLRISGGDVPAAVRRATLAELAGRKVLVGGLQAVIPSPLSTDFSGSADLGPPEGIPPTGIRGRVVVTSSVRRGTAHLRLSTRGLPPGNDAEVWVEDFPGSGTWSPAGVMIRNRLDLDTARGDPLPGVAPDGTFLSGRGIEVRTGDAVLLQGTMP